MKRMTYKSVFNDYGTNKVYETAEIFNRMGLYEDILEKICEEKGLTFEGLKKKYFNK